VIVDRHPIHKSELVRDYVAKLEDRLKASLRRTQKLPELVKSFFRQPECQYVEI
jgi:hypothetical protein